MPTKYSPKPLFARLLLRAFPLYRPLLPSGYRPYSVPGGKIMLDIKESPMMLARALGQYESDKFVAIERFLGPGSVFVDVGANKGDFSLAAAARVGATGRVLAFEPEPANCRWIRESLGLNGYANVDLLELALSDGDGSARLHLGDKSGWHSLVDGLEGRGQGEITVETRRLDTVVAAEGLASVDMIKIDVEGADLQVLRGAEQTLADSRDVVVLMDIHPQLGVDALEVCGFLAERGFSLYTMTPPFDTRAHVHAGLTEVLARR